MRAMPRLSESQRQVILLKFIEGFENAEIAAVLDKTEGAIRVLQHRALTALRLALAEEVQHEPA
jgi:RNA polymerase sigma-70 factor (ECF subfamily)